MNQEEAGFRRRSASDCDEFVFHSPSPSTHLSLIHPDLLQDSKILEELDEELFSHMDEDPLGLFDNHLQKFTEHPSSNTAPKEFNAENPAWKLKVPISLNQDRETAEKLILEGIFDTSREVYDEDYERKQDEKNKLTFGNDLNDPKGHFSTLLEFCTCKLF